MANPNRDDQRRILEVSFEPHGDQYLFYRHRWSFGVPVSAQEREEYLAIPMWGSRRAFYRKIADRQPVAGRRDHRQTQRKLSVALPPGIGIVCILSGAASIHHGLVEQGVLWALLDCGGGAFALAGGLMIIIAGRRTPR